MTGNSNEQPAAIPSAALWLGWAGVIPFAGLAAIQAAGLAIGPFSPLNLLLLYAACILSFMGGVQWGIAMMKAGGDGRGWHYAVSVIPALISWLALLIPASDILRIAILMVGFVGLLAFDIWTVRQALAPGWYTRLRLQLTLAVVCSLVMAGLG